MASFSRNDMVALLSHIRYINLGDSLSGYVAITAGLLVSLWSHCILVVICIQNSYYAFTGQAYVERLVINCAQITYLVIVVAGIVGLMYASKHKDKMYVYPWMCTKIFETVLSLVGTILLATGRQRFIGLMSVSLICLLAGGYLSLCAWNATRKLGGRGAQAAAEETEPMPTVIDEKPPSYDHFTNQV